MRGSMNRFIWLFLLIFFAPSLSASVLKREQGYDKPIYSSGTTPTTFVDSDRIFFLPEKSHPAALQVLAGKKVLGINESQSTALLGENIDTSALLDTLAQKIDKDVQQRQKSFELKPQLQTSFWDFFGKSDDVKQQEVAQEYIRLDHLHADYVRSLKGRLKPYLIAIEAPLVAVHNISGWVEKDSLHLSIAQPENHSEISTQPFIVFLEFEPKAVIPHRLTFR